MINNESMFKVGYNFLTWILIIEALYLSYQIYFSGYNGKVFLTLGFMLFSKLSQINIILYFNRLEKQKI